MQLKNSEANHKKFWGNYFRSFKGRSTKKHLETQYQMIMAISHNKYTKALPFLYGLCKKKIEPMICIGLGDSITRLELINSNSPITLKNMVKSIITINNRFIIEGCLRALSLFREKHSR